MIQLQSPLKLKKSMKRRKFIKTGAVLSAGTLLLPPALLNPRDRSSAVQAAIAPKYKPELSLWADDEINIAWIGHATVLIKLFGKWILTDPVFSERVGVSILGATIGPPRFTLPALEQEELPKPDIILLSHAHMDHMDVPTLSFFADKYPGQIDVVTAYRTSDVIEHLEWKSLREIDWQESYDVADIRFRALPVKHFGWRFPWERDRSKGFFKTGRGYNAYLIEHKGKKIVFGGDTAFTNTFADLKDEGIEVAIMPIGAYNPWKSVHCDPEEALQMADQMRAKYFIPIHCYTFKQGVAPVTEPLKWLVTSAPNYNTRLGLVQIGQTLKLV
jgi:L-ascorbate metabolism protein UlaG (beta-lactamase superfamily)